MRVEKTEPIIFPLQGEYSDYQCGLEITDARDEDQGEWSCEMESYVKGGRRGYGYKVEVRFRYCSSSQSYLNPERQPFILVFDHEYFF